VRKKTVEEYIELIYTLEKRDGHAHTGAIASDMRIKPPSVTEMLQKLEKEGLVIYQSYSGANLTARGEVMARKLMEKHRVFEEFLGMIGIEKKIAEREACQIEHHVNTKTARQLEKFVHYLKKKNDDEHWLDQFRELR